MNADVTVKIYDNMGHTINQDEIEMANRLIFEKSNEQIAGSSKQ